MNVRKTLSLLLALALCLGLLVVPAGAAEFTRGKTYTPGQFTDVPESAWYAGSVKDCFELGLMSGSSADSFNPTGMFTLAEAATIAARMHNLYAGGNGVMPPSAGAWYQSAVDYCVKNGIFGAKEFNSFTRNATRAEMAGIMAKALPDSAWEAKNSVAALPDVNRATDYADAIFKLYDAGVFTGSDDYGMFQPQASITRAEVAAIVARCADQSQRKTLSLKPLSQREAPVLIGGYDKDSKMSNGRLRFQDPDTKKYGYLDGNGNVAIAAQYDEAEDFEAGYADVSISGKHGLIDVNGVVTVPLEYYWVNNMSVSGKNGWEGLVVNGRLVTPVKYLYIDPLDDGLYTVDQMGKGVVNSAGQEIIPRQYDNITYNGLYCICSKDNQYDIYNTSGQLLASYDTAEIRSAKNSQLLAVKEGNKWAVATVNGKITEAVYDDVWLKDDSDLAVVEYGNQEGLAGLNGEIFAPGLHDDCSIDGEYAGYLDDGTIHIATAAGDMLQLEGEYQALLSIALFDNYIFVGTDYGTYSLCSGVLFDLNGKALLSFPSVTEYGGIFRARAASGYYYFYDPETAKSYGPATDFYGDGSRSSNNSFYRYRDLDGNWQYIFDNRAKTDYIIKNNDAGKPCVYYKDTPVIEFYKNNIYYDEIKDIGEGYYACRYNTTWYLVHAD